LKPNRIKTGVPGLDKMLGGGIPEGRVVLLVGGPGTGKTIFCSQFLVNGIEMYGDNGVFVSLDEGKSPYLREMSVFGWGLEKLEQDKRWSFVNASPIKHTISKNEISNISIGSKDFSLLNLISEIKNKVDEIKAKRVVVDPITSLVFQYPDVINRRTAILNIVEGLTEIGVTSMVTTELKTSGFERNIQLEEYLAHGVIVLQTLQVGKTSIRAIQIEKMRETSIDPQIRPYRITEKGIEIYPKESVF